MAERQYPMYPAQLLRVIDGDTYKLDVDLGFYVHTHMTGRLDGIDCPEASTPEGQAAKTQVIALFQAFPDFTVQSQRDKQTFARWVIAIHLPDGRLFSALLISMGLVKRGPRQIPAPPVPVTVVEIPDPKL